MPSLHSFPPRVTCLSVVHKIGSNCIGSPVLTIAEHIARRRHSSPTCSITRELSSNRTMGKVPKLAIPSGLPSRILFAVAHVIPTTLARSKLFRSDSDTEGSSMYPLPMGSLSDLDWVYGWINAKHIRTSYWFKLTQTNDGHGLNKIHHHLLFVNSFCCT